MDDLSTTKHCTLKGTEYLLRIYKQAAPKDVNLRTAQVYEYLASNMGLASCF